MTAFTEEELLSVGKGLAAILNSLPEGLQSILLSMIMAEAENFEIRRPLFKQDPVTQEGLNKLLKQYPAPWDMDKEHNDFEECDDSEEVIQGSEPLEVSEETEGSSIITQVVEKINLDCGERELLGDEVWGLIVQRALDGCKIIRLGFEVEQLNFTEFMISTHNRFNHICREVIADRFVAASVKPGYFNCYLYITVNKQQEKKLPPYFDVCKKVFFEKPKVIFDPRTEEDKIFENLNLSDEEKEEISDSVKDLIIRHIKKGNYIYCLRLIMEKQESQSIMADKVSPMLGEKSELIGIGSVIEDLHNKVVFKVYIASPVSFICTALLGELKEEVLGLSMIYYPEK